MKKPSLTELIKLLDKPALLTWANKQGLSGIDITKKRREWLDYGTSLHNQIYEYITSGIELVKHEEQLRLKHFFSDKQIIAAECSVENEYFTGKYDLKYLKNGKQYLSDYKSNARKIYFEHKLQLIGYAMCEECDSFSIISIPSFIEMTFNIKDRTPYHEIIKSLSNIYKQKQIIDENRI